MIRRVQKHFLAILRLSSCSLFNLDAVSFFGWCRMVEDRKLNEKGKEQYPMSRIIIGNIVMFLGLVVGTIAIWFYSPIMAAIYLIIAVITVYVILRKLVCTNCYYYDKWCSLGWGKLAAALFKRGDIEQFNDSIGIRLAPIVYGLLTIFPLIVVIVALVLEFDYYKVGVLVILVFFAIYSGGISRRSACADCKMNTVCKGSVVKQ